MNKRALFSALMMTWILAGAYTAAAGSNPSPGSIDFNKIDTPQVAILLPALNDALHYTWLEKTFSRAVKERRRLSAWLEWRVSGALGGELWYSAVPEHASMKGSGMLGTANVEETWRMETGPGSAIVVDGQIGDTAEHLCWERGDVIGDPARIHGAVGTMGIAETHEDGRRGSTEGTIDGETLHIDIDCHQDDATSETVTAHGTIATTPLIFRLKQSGHFSEKEGDSVVSGDGSVGKISVSFSGTAKFGPAQRPSPLTPHQ